MQTALKDAGIAFPSNERIWRWLKDNPNSTGAKIASVLKIPANNVATLCLSMCKRDMLTNERISMRCKTGKGFAMRDVLTYSTNPKMETYELWPAPAKEKPPVPRPEPKAAPVVAEATAPLTMWTPDRAVEKLSLGQCRELFDYLNNIFNPKGK
jgi:hypothetical protein